MEQINKMAFTLSELKLSLEVYKGLFQLSEDAEVILAQFPEIGSTLKKSLSVNIIIGCAALFTDSDITSGNHNMSFKNLYKKYNNKLSDEAIELKTSIDQIVLAMKLKEFRNKYVGHFDLANKLGKSTVNANITTDNLGELIIKGQRLLNCIIRDARLLPTDHYLAYDIQIPESSSIKSFLDRLQLS